MVVPLCVSASLRMSVQDFQLHFDLMEVCHLTEGLSEPGAAEAPWSCVKHHGTWVPSITAGGSPVSGEVQRQAVSCGNVDPCLKSVAVSNRRSGFCFLW